MRRSRAAAERQGFCFDRQAAGFDRRAGLPAAAAERIAAAVLQLAAGGVLLDVGAGTGEIGRHLARRRRYLGLDLSLAMLAAYRRKLGGALGPLIQADAGRRWPVAGATVGTLLLSRAAHLLPPEHLAAEASRVADSRGAVLILGRVRRSPDSLRSRMRQRMLELLAERGIAGRGGERSRRRLKEACERHGATVAPPLEVASWPVIERAADSLAAWRGKEGLAGRALEPRIRREVLRRLERWARERVGDLAAARHARESYELTAIDLPHRVH